MKIVPDEEFIASNFNKTVDLLSKLGLDDLRKLVENFAEEYATAPASPRKEYYSAFPGGLCYHNLSVLKSLHSLSTLMAPNEFSKQTLTKVAILHDFGKVGIEGTPYFVRQTSDWHTDKGIFYETNPYITFMKVQHRSLFLAQEHGIPLTQDEYLAILLSEGQDDETNVHYRHKEAKLAYLLNTAVQWSRKLERENEVIWP